MCAEKNKKSRRSPDICVHDEIGCFNGLVRNAIAAGMDYLASTLPRGEFLEEYHNGTGYYDPISKIELSESIVLFRDENGRVIIAVRGDSCNFLVHRHHTRLNWIVWGRGSVRELGCLQDYADLFCTLARAATGGSLASHETEMRALIQRLK